MFEAPRINEFTQGTIFSCAYAENYGDSPVYGITVTARCDAAQGKTPIYNYIPVVALEDWVLKDGAEIILKRAESSAINTKRNIIIEMGLSESLLRTKSTEEIIQGHLLPKTEVDRKSTKKLQQFQAQEQILLEINKSVSSDKTQRNQTLKKHPSHVNSILQDLSGNRLTGYYLLRGMPSLYEDKGRDYVALLREVHHVPRLLVEKIMQGIHKEEWLHVESSGVKKCPAFCGDDDYCMPIARMRSPWIEHLMQSWTILFSRIGVEDIDVSSVKKSLANLGL